MQHTFPVHSLQPSVYVTVSALLAALGRPAFDLHVALADGDDDGLGQVVFFVAVGGRCMKHGVEVVDAVQ